MIISADPAMPDVLATPDVVNPIMEISPQVEHRAIPGAGHLVHDGLATRDGFVDQVEDSSADIPDAASHDSPLNRRQWGSSRISVLTTSQACVGWSWTMWSLTSSW